MGEVDFETLKGPKAIVCHREINGEAGGATVFCVVLADGFIVECGSSGYSKKRAILLADIINAAGPEHFDFARSRS